MKFNMDVLRKAFGGEKTKPIEKNDGAITVLKVLMNGGTIEQYESGVVFVRPENGEDVNVLDSLGRIEAFDFLLRNNFIFEKKKGGVYPQFMAGGQAGVSQKSSTFEATDAGRKYLEANLR
ncbi:MAG: hypothetical protein WC806_06665 [Candidatus Gracilibacteria bacterium]|jgi:hypothetical protein